MRRPALILVSALILLCTLSCSARTVYVKWDSPGPTFDGGSWDTAFHTVTAGLDAAASGDEVWVARGTYVECITLKIAVGLYGGFLGTETSRDQRDFRANETVLDGNSQGGVVSSPAGASNTTAIDGFTIRRGRKSYGGGISCKSSSPTISNNVISDNYASDGGGIYCYMSSPLILRNTIRWNYGGIYCSNSSPTISHNIIMGNRRGGVSCGNGSAVVSHNIIAGNSCVSASGAGISCTGAAIITNNLIVGNLAVGRWFYDGQTDTWLPASGGGIYSAGDAVIAGNTIRGNAASDHGGGIAARGGSIHNNAIVGNSGRYGGGVASLGNSVALTNNTIAWNAVEGIYLPKNVSECPRISNNIVAFNREGVCREESGSSYTVGHNCVYGNTDGDYRNLTAPSDDIVVDPKLVPLQSGGFHIQPDSPCIDAGYDSVVQPEWHDIDGQARVGGEHVDIGADESDGIARVTVPKIVRVSTEGDDSADGSDWTHPMRTLQAAIFAAAPYGGEVWAKYGVYTECIALSTGVRLYGGFRGTEMRRDERDWQANPTIIDANRLWSAVEIIAGDSETTIDGFTIREGFAHGPYVQDQYGAGIFCWLSSITICNNILTGNEALTDGGGIYSLDSSVLIRNNRIAGNTSASSGGGIAVGNYTYAYTYIRGTDHRTSISDNIVEDNSAGSGGGVWVDTANVLISDNEIVHNSAGTGGGIYSHSAPITIADNTISENTASSTLTAYGGGGIFTYYSPKITGNIITRNSTSGTCLGGGGIHCYSDSPTIVGNIITGNTSSSSADCSGGAGIYCNSSSPTIAGNLIADNSSSATGADSGGGGIRCQYGAMKITNNTIAGNTSQGPGTDSQGGGVYYYGSGYGIPPAISNNAVAFNSSGMYSNSTNAPILRNNDVHGNIDYDYSGLTAGIGDISIDPQFVDRANGDYHLGMFSPCLNAGWNDAQGLASTDIDGDNRIIDGTVDIGADEFSGIATSLRDTKLGADHMVSLMTGCAVTAVFDGFFYIEAEDRSCGIRVVKASHGLQAGDFIDLNGVLKTNADGERYIDASWLIKTQTRGIAPMHINPRFLGGGDWFYDPATGAGQKGVIGGAGLNNIGLLVTTWGKITYLDGAYALDLGANKTAKVLAEGMSIGGKGTYCRITGISSCYRDADGLHPTIRVTEITPLQ